jgi:tetratricopeptide (TPR) repeat protein
VDNQRHQAQAAFDRGDARGCLEAAAAGLAAAPDDVVLLRLAGRAGADLDPEIGAGYLRQLVALVPDDATAWDELGRALLDDGDLDGAAQAFRVAVRLQPDTAALVDLGLTVYALGQRAEAVSLLSQALDADPTNVAVLRSLIEMHRRDGDAEALLARAQQVVAARPDDVLALLDIADQQLARHDLPATLAAFERVRHVDLEIGHEVYALHGEIEAHLARQEWRPALDLAIAATAVDRHQLTTDLLVFISSRLFGQADPSRSPREWDDLAASLAEARAEHRRLHAEALV